MTQKREFYAVSVEEAVAKAAGELGVDRGELSYRVVDEGNSGFLGIGARDARIEVDAAPGNGPVAEEDPAPEAMPVAVDGERPDVAEDSNEVPLTEPSPQADEEHASIDGEVLAEVEERVTALLGAMDFEARVDVYDAGGFVAADVAPDNTALFIGQKGETIDALQYLVNASVNKNRSTRTRVVVDAEGYRQRRVEALQGMAHRTARRALREDRAVELPPMNPAERRVVHIFLRDNPQVTTESEGSGDSRRVRILPA